MFGWLEALIRDSPATYPIACAAVALDAFFPVPGGRTAVTFTSGMLDMRWRRFAAADLLGTGLWAVYAVGLGWYGGGAFKDSFWKPMLVSFGIAGVVALVGEIVRRLTESGEDEGAADRDVDEILGRA